MAYSVIGSGRKKLGQSQAIFDGLANTERQRNALNDQMHDARDQADAQAITSTAGIVGSNIAAAAAADAAAATAATAAGTAAPAATGIAAAIGPVGWVALGGLALYGLFGR